jgi:hypothetical protein
MHFILALSPGMPGVLDAMAAFARSSRYGTDPSVGDAAELGRCDGGTTGLDWITAINFKVESCHIRSLKTTKKRYECQYHPRVVKITSKPDEPREFATIPKCKLHICGGIRCQNTRVNSEHRSNIARAGDAWDSLIKNMKAMRHFHYEWPLHLSYNSMALEGRFPAAGLGIGRYDEGDTDSEQFLK